MSTGFAVPTDFSNTSGGNYEPIPADNYPGVCVGVLELGTHNESYQGGPMKKVRKVKLQFELSGPERSDGKAAIISASYNFSLHEKATFRKMLDGWLGNDWTERFKGQSWRFLIGLPAMVNVESGPSKRDPSRTSSWVASVSKYPRNLPAPKPTRDLFFLDLSERTLPETLSVWDAEKVRASDEYAAGGFNDNAPKPNGTNAAGGAPSRPVANGLASPVSPPPSCPPAVAAVLAKLNMAYPFRVDDIPDQISDEDLALISPHAIPF